MQLQVKLSESKHALLTGNTWHLSGRFYLESAQFITAECVDIDEIENGWALVFRSPVYHTWQVKAEAFELKLSGPKTFLSRYEKVRTIAQEGRLYFYVTILEKEID